MEKIILITGGSRSGKSALAQEIAERRDGSRLFLATCPVTDDEMAERIQRHIADRQSAGWNTVEEQIDEAGRLKTESGYDVVLVDCLTLWINNLMYEAHRNKLVIDEELVVDRTSELIMAARNYPGTIIFVTNEVGLGIVPDNKISRLYRDLIGRCNQHVAAAADQVYLVSCGIPLKIKGTDNAF